MHSVQYVTYGLYLTVADLVVSIGPLVQTRFTDLGAGAICETLAAKVGHDKFLLFRYMLLSGQSAPHVNLAHSTLDTFFFFFFFESIVFKRF